MLPDFKDATHPRLFETEDGHHVTNGGPLNQEERRVSLAGLSGFCDLDYLSQSPEVKVCKTCETSRWGTFSSTCSIFFWKPTTAFGWTFCVSNKAGRSCWGAPRGYFFSTTRNELLGQAYLLTIGCVFSGQSHLLRLRLRIEIVISGFCLRLKNPMNKYPSAARQINKVS